VQHTVPVRTDSWGEAHEKSQRCETHENGQKYSEVKEIRQK
jgi:hypothetical protein